MTRIRNIALAVLFVGVVAACGSSASSSGAPTTTPTTSSSSPSSGSGSVQSGHVTVMISNFKYVPATLTVKPGTKVTFTNEDSVPHTATSAGSSTVNSPTLSKGQSYTVTLTKPGTYKIGCTFHSFMHGVVIVS